MIAQASHLSAGYGRLAVLHDVSISIPEHGAVAILGPNGAGKSTLLKVLARLLPVLDGSLQLRGEPYESRSAPWAARNGVALVPQEREVFSDLTVSENLALSARLSDRPKEATEKVLADFPILRERSSQLAGSLSGGERKILAISSALLTDPALLLLDEPTAGLAPQARLVVAKLIDSAVESRTAIVWVVEQAPEFVLDRVDHAYLIEAGQVRFGGEPRELLDRQLT